MAPHAARLVALLLTPAVLASLVLAAHFLRRGELLPCAACLALAALAFVRRPWARRVWQAFLGLGTLVWLVTLSSLVRVRIHDGEPWVRPTIILGSVAAFTLVAAGLLEHRRAYAYYRAPTEAP